MNRPPYPAPFSYPMNLRVLLGFCAVLALGGCDTPEIRARCHPGAFGKLSAADRRMVLAGKVHPGMDTAAVYIALGEPDAKSRVAEGKDPSQTWLYRRRLTLKGAMDSFDRWLPGNRVFGQTPFFGGGGFGFGGIGNEGMTVYQPHLLVSDDTVRSATFEGGQLAHYEEFQAGDAPLR